MSALTRIFNNQIYNSTIVGYQKIAPGTLTGSLFASNVTVPGDLLIAGNLFVLGSSSYTVIASTNTYVNDPLVTLNNGFSGTNTFDEGLILNRGTSQNQAIIWSEFNKEFRMIGTTETGTTYGNVVASSFANLHVGNIGVDYNIRSNTLTVNTAITATSINLSGNVLAAAATVNSLTVNGNETVTGFLNVTGNVLASQARLNYLDVNGNVDLGLAGAVSGSWINIIGNITQTSAGGAVYFNTTGNISTAQLNAGQINTTGNVLGQSGTFNALTVNGGITSTGFFNTSGNISTAQLNAGQINTTGNVLAAAATVNALTVNGNESVTGFLNVTGNVMTAQLNAGQINTTGNVLGQAGTFNALTVNGNETVTGFLNVTGNVLASTVGASFLTASTATVGNIAAVNFGNAGATFTGASINLSGNVLAAAGTFNGLTVNGNETVTGFLNVTGNVLASQARLNYLDVNGNVDLGLAGAISGSWVNVIGNITQTSAGGPVYINTTGNVSAAVGVFGAINSTGYINTTGNISTAQLNAGQINTTGNVLATAGTFNALTVNGNETVTGFLNVTGNIIAAIAEVSTVEASGMIRANSTATTTSTTTGAIVTPGGIGVGGAANIGGTITTAGAAQLNSTLTVGGITSLTNTTNSTESTGSSGALQIKGGTSIAKDLWVGGNIYASNIFGVTHQVITVQDPLVYFDAANTFPYNYDIGFYSNFVGPNPIDNTGNAYQHSGVVRDNADNTWKFFSNVRTEPAGTAISFDADTIYDPVLAGNLRLTYTQAATSTTTGALQVAGGAGIAGAVVAGQINSTGNVLGQAGTFNALTVNGGITSTGFFNTSGNISTAQLNAGQINTTGNVLAATVLATLVTAGDATFGNVASGFIGNTGTAYTGASINLSGNVLAAAGVYNALTVNGNETVTGYLNVTGNVLASTVGASFVTASAVAVGNISAVTIGNSGATVTGTTGTFGAVNSGFVGNTGTAFTGASINVSGNVLASSVLTNFLTADDVVFGNVSASVFGNVGAVFTGASINLTGNVLSTGAVHNAMAVNGNTSLGLAGAISGSWTTVIGNITQSTSGGAVYFNTAGNVMAAQGFFGSINSTGYINTTGNISTAQLNAGQINTTGNVLAATVRSSFLTASTVAVGNISAVTIGNAGATVTGTTAAFSGNVIGGLAQFASINGTPVGNAVASTGAFTTLSASAGIWANSTTASTTTTTGAIVVAGGIGLAGNVRAGGGAVFNSSQTADPFQVRGVAATSLIYADTAYGAVVIGGSNTATPFGTTLKVNGTDTMMLPIGTTAQRPSNTGNVDLPGMIRFNSSINNMEFYDGSIWQTSGSVFSIITDRQFAGNVAGGYGNVDGTNTTFTIQANSTTSGTIVSINGVIQFPVLAYNVSGTTLTFAEPPAPEDVIDVRVLATTLIVSVISSGNGVNQFQTSNEGSEIWSGTSVTVRRVLVDQVGNFNYLTGNKITYDQVPVNVPTAGVPVAIDSWSQTAYTSAKYHVTAKVGATNVETYEIIALTDGAGNAFITTYGVINNGSSIGGFTASVVGGNVVINYTSVIAQANVKAMGTYIV